MLVWEAALYAAGGPETDVTGVSPDLLARTLVRHRLLSHSRSRPGWTIGQRQELKPLWLAASARTLAHAALHAEFAVLFAGLPYTVVKGDVLYRLLGASEQRDHTDVDLWIRPPHYDVALDRLEATGWTVTTSRRLQEVQLQRAGRTIDVHQRLFAPRHALEPVNQALVACRAGDGALPPLAHALLALCNGGKDLWPTLRTVADVKVIAEHTDLAALATLADQTRTRGIVDHAMGLCDHLLGPTGWSAAHPVDLQPLIDELQRPLARTAPERFLTTLRLREHRRDRAMALFQTMRPQRIHDHPIAGSRTLGRLIRLFRKYGPGYVGADTLPPG